MPDEEWIDDAKERVQALGKLMARRVRHSHPATGEQISIIVGDTTN
jgi:hypothetical protein